MTRRLRSSALVEGLSWHKPMPSMFEMEEDGFWALTRRADIAFASQHPEFFTSTQGVALDPMPAEVQQIATFFLMMDPPQHTVYRRLISSAFTPKNVRRIEKQIHENAVAVVGRSRRRRRGRLRRSVLGAATDDDDHRNARCAAIGTGKR